ncbi:MAG: hypothetical protein KKF43_16640, partial [Proteobacteria bacterium]|nr:hypothetical protein [Pseudomonadota bacterium]
MESSKIKTCKYQTRQFLGESSRKSPFEVKTQSEKRKDYHQGETPEKKAGITLDKRILHPWL